MDNEEVRKWLDAAWRKALEAGSADPDPEIDRLTNSEVVSIRYALITQILGKIADPARSLLALQSAAADDGAWNARSFSTAVVVPWVAENHNVLGTSAEPYASKPLRRKRLTDDMDDVRSGDEWDALVALLARLNTASSEELRDVFRRILVSLARKLAQQSFTYPVPQRISLPQLQTMLDEFLAASSGGLRPLAVAAALFRTLGEAFSLFDSVESQGVNEADAASGMPGDISCRKDGEVRLAVEVKDVDLTLAHVQASARKAREAETELSNLLFAVPGVRVQDREEIAALAQRNWAAGLNICTVSIQNLVRSVFSLLQEKWRIRFVRAVCRELDDRQNQPARKAWHDLLLAQH